MKIRHQLHFWSRLLLWSHVVGVIGFYISLWLRTSTRGVQKMPCDVKQHSHTGAEPTGNSAGEQAALVADRPFVSIIVPVRNEERNIQRCVTSLLEQDYEHYEVIVVDDGSTDDTAQILESIAQTHPHGSRMWVLRLRELPPGWAGKPHALHAGVQESHGDWLLFTDADTSHAPNALSCVLTAAINENVDLYSIGTEQVLPGFWEKVMMPMAYLGIGMLYPVKKVNDPRSSVALANGQFILIRRAVYDMLGGYARPELRGALVDDLELARTVKHSGFRLRLEDGRGLVRVRMYRGLRDAWRGWRKNVFLGNRGGLAFVLVQLIGLPAISIVPFLLPLMILLTGNNRPHKERAGFWRREQITPAEVIVATLLELGPLLAYRVSINKEMKVPWYYAFTHPLAGALFEAILTQSAWRVLTRKGVDWRGRQYYNGTGA